MGKFVHPRSREARKTAHSHQRERRLEEQELGHRAAARHPVLFKLRFFRHELLRNPQKYVYTPEEYADIVCKYLERCVEISRDPSLVGLIEGGDPVLEVESKDPAAELVCASGPKAGPQPFNLKSSSNPNLSAGKKVQHAPGFGKKESEVSKTLRRQALARTLQQAQQGLLQVPDLGTEALVKDLLVWDGTMKTSHAITLTAFPAGPFADRISRIIEEADDLLNPH